MSTLRPTRHCFDDALEFISERVKENPALAHTSALILVHAICRGALDGPHPDEPYAHAWVEEDDLCWDAALVGEHWEHQIYYAVARDEFYAARRVTTTTRYTVRQACLENLRSGTFGPWRPEYRALCGGDRILGSIPATIDTKTEGR